MMEEMKQFLQTQPSLEDVIVHHFPSFSEKLPDNVPGFEQECSPDWHTKWKTKVVKKAFWDPFYDGNQHFLYVILDEDKNNRVWSVEYHAT